MDPHPDEGELARNIDAEREEAGLFGDDEEGTREGGRKAGR